MHRRGGKKKSTALERGNSFERSRYRLFDADGPPPAGVVAAAAVAGVVVVVHDAWRNLSIPPPPPPYRARIRRTRTFPVLGSGLVNVHRERLFLPHPPPPLRGFTHEERSGWRR